MYDLFKSGKSFAYSSLCLSGFLRIVTHPRIFIEPTDLATALEFTRILTELPQSVAVEPQHAHWHILSRLCYTVKPRGNLIPDTYFAALAMESGTTWVTFDRDFLRFPGLDCEIL